MLVYSPKLLRIFSLNRKTRVLLRIIIEIIKDIFPFLILCLTVTLTFAIMFTSTIPSDELELKNYP